MKFENAAIVMTDTDTGKPYARPLSAWELNLVLSQLQALDGGALKAREIAPFVMRTVGISQEAAERIANKQSGLHYVARQGAKAFEDMAQVNREQPAITDRLIGKRVSVQIKRAVLPPPPTGPNPIDAARVDAEKTKCWNCKTEWPAYQVREDDGFCPGCHHEIAEDD